ncbi:MAG: BamA/TamA family outer membrane protein [Bacteroidetes bacterium]|nr:BamA/TamA family outer membrane protein [Bacteroidota bacterium]
MIALAIFMSGCSLTKTVPEGKYLLMKVKYDLHDIPKQKQNLPEFKELNSYKPNRKILGITRFHLKLFNLASSTKDSSLNNKKLRRYFRNVGEPPVLFDSAMADKASTNIKQFFFNNGYYDVDVFYTVKYKRKKVKYLMYHISPNYYYRIQFYTLDCKDSVLRVLLKNSMRNSFFKGGRRLEFETINQERERVLSIIRNNGYFDFKKDYIDFELDTFRQSHNVDIKLIIALPIDKNVLSVYRTDEVALQIHSPYHKPFSEFYTFDSIKYYTNGYPFSAKLLHNNQLIRRGQIYNQSELNQTYRRLSELGVFNTVEIETTKSLTDSFSLNTSIIVTPGKLQSFTIEPQLISSDLSNQIANLGNYRNYGVAGILTYSHKNIFKGAERLDLSYTLRAESQLRAQENYNRFFTNFQTGITANLFVPSSYLWQSLIYKKKLNSVKSVFSISYIYENNLDFNRKILPASFSYQFVKDRNVWLLTPMEISYSNSRIVPGFLDKISGQNLEYVKRLFANNLITSSGLRWSYSHFKSGNPKEYIIWRINLIEFGGNIHRIVRRAMDKERTTDTTYDLLGVNYFQFAKSEIDLRIGKYIDINNALAFRFNVGAGVPYGNDDILPFDKRFFIGGSNSLRGWRPRTLGPGSYIDTTSGTRIDRSGDLIIQGSIEYRFKFIKPLELGVFMDAGNVWNIVPNSGTTQPEMFDFRKFIGELALNTGIGFRFDFEFFIFRLDWGIQLKDPGITKNKGWVAKELFKPKGINYTVLNAGVGYPF